MKKQTKTKSSGGNGGGAVKPASAAAPRAPGVFKVLKASSLLRSPTNPRKTFPEGPLRELAVNIGQHGIKQPLLVRPLPRYEVADPDLITPEWGRLLKDGVEIDKGPPNFMRMKLAECCAGRDGKEYEIVCGERRDRAAELAGLEERPCMVEVLTDTEVEEIQLIENLQREDLNKLEEAAGYQKLMKDHGLSADQLAQRLGRPRSRVFAILALLKLTPGVKKALETGEITPSVAELLGRFQGEKMQEKALELLRDNSDSDYVAGETLVTPISYRKAQLLLNEEFTKELKEAKFDLGRVYALPYKPGVPGECLPVCATCPKRSGNCAYEWPELEDTEVCTDPTCFRRKEEVHAAETLAPFREKGLKTLGLKESEGLFQFGHLRSSRFCEADATCYEDKKRRTIKQILGEKMPAAVVALQSGKPVKLYEQAAVQKALAGIGIGKGAKEDERASRELEEKIEAETTKRLWAELRPLLVDKKADEMLRTGLRMLMEDQDDVHWAMQALEMKGAWPGVLDKLSPPAMARLLLVGRLADWEGEWRPSAMEAAAKAFGVDVAAVKKAAKKAVEEPGLDGVDGSVMELKKVAYLINTHEVFVRPDSIQVPFPAKAKVSVVFHLAYDGKAWRVGHQFQKIGGVGCGGDSGPASKTGPAWPTAKEAIYAAVRGGQDWLVEKGIDQDVWAWVDAIEAKEDDKTAVLKLPKEIPPAKGRGKK